MYLIFFLVIFIPVGNIVSGRYCYSDDLLSPEGAVPHKVALPDECIHLATPLNLDVWSLLLSTLIGSWGII